LDKYASVGAQLPVTAPSSIFGSAKTSSSLFGAQPSSSFGAAPQRINK